MNFGNIDSLFAYLDKGNAITSSHVTNQEILIFHALCCELLSVIIKAITRYQDRLSDELQTHEVSRKTTNCMRILNMLNMLRIVVTSDTETLQENTRKEGPNNITPTTISWSGVLGLTVLHGIPVYRSDAYKSGSKTELAQLIININKGFTGFPLAEAWQFVQTEAETKELDDICDRTLDVITCACKLIPNYESQSG